MVYIQPFKNKYIPVKCVNMYTYTYSCCVYFFSFFCILWLETYFSHRPMCLPPFNVEILYQRLMSFLASEVGGSESEVTCYLGGSFPYYELCACARLCVYGKDCLG